MVQYQEARYLGIETVTTVDGALTELMSEATLIAGGLKNIRKISLATITGALWIVPNVSEDDALNANADAAQANVTVTDGTKFTVGDIVLLYNNDNTSYEWAEIKSIATHVLTMTAVLSNAYTTAKASRCAKVRNRNEFFKVKKGMVLNEENTNFTSLWVRRASSTDVSVDGYVGVN